MFVLDTSAVLAVLLDERGSAEVVPHLPGSEISIVNWCEVLTKSIDQGGDLAEVERILRTYGMRIRSFRDEHATEVARLRPLTRRRGLGLGDRACLAQGRFSNRPVMTADKAWSDLDVGVDIRLIR